MLKFPWVIFRIKVTLKCLKQVCNLNIYYLPLWEVMPKLLIKEVWAWWNPL
jgi:hypothetical protein